MMTIMTTKSLKGRCPPPISATRHHKTKSLSLMVQLVALAVLLLDLVGGVGGGILECTDNTCIQTFSVYEDVPVNTFVGTVGSPRRTGMLPFLEFLSTSSLDARRVFNVDLETGNVTTKSPLDRESALKGYVFILTSRNFTYVEVTVFLLDVNDNPPVFSTPFKALKFSESTRPGAKKSLGRVTDPDKGRNATQKCEIVSGNLGNAFVVAVARKHSVENDLIIELVVNEPLNFELFSAYSLVIRAVDGGGLHSEMRVNITVLDQNDNQPVFTRPKYEVEVYENVPVGTSIIQVEATDQDSGLNGRIRYSIKSKSNAEGRFRIDSVTGVVYVEKPLDYETSPEGYRLILEAADAGPHKLIGNAALDVKLVNINEQPANIRLIFLQGADRQGHIPENTRAGTPVARISIDDPDMDRQIDVNVTLLGGHNVFGLQIMDDVRALVVVNTPPDREVKATYDLTVMVTEAGNPPLRASDSFTVFIDDVNDNPPRFQQNPYLAEVQEAAEVGTSVLRVTATDKDEGDNSKITYAIKKTSASNSEWFEIDANTGVITTRERIDCELNDQPMLVVTARDNGETPLSGSTTVLITVRDVNDKQPEFETSFYNARLSEDAAIGDCPIEGVLITRDTLDRESQDLYALTVVATDHGTPRPQSATASIGIHVTDTNDNAPVFTPARYKFNVLENQPLGSHVGQVTASDRDAGDNQRLRYRFSHDQPRFAINTHSGEITTVAPLDREEQQDYVLTVNVTDSGVQPRSDTAVVKVQVLDANDNDPEFTVGDEHRETVSENRPKGVRVMKVVAHDRDAGENGTVYFYLDPARSDEEGLSNFRIHPTTGWLVTDEVLDYESRTQYRLTVVAHDNGSPPRSRSVVIVIDVDDDNDNDEAPLLHAREVNLYVMENVPVGTRVGAVKVEDKGTGESGGMMYYLVGGNVFSSFAVDSHTGVIQTVREIDFEASSSHLLNIQAVDSDAIFPRSSNISVIVHIVDVNDNAAAFDKDPVYLRMVRENTAVGHVVHTFITTDRDAGANGTVRYSVEAETASGPDPTPGNYFNIDAVTGELSVAKHIDYERVHSMAIIVRARDDCPVADLALSSKVTAVVLVVDVNDNRPVFESRSSVSVVEDEPVGFQVIFIVAVDIDSDQHDSGNNAVNYGIVSGNDDGKFRLDPNTGLLTIHEALDRETRPLYVLNISAQDAGVPKMAAFQQLSITVVDVNDNTPRFQLSLYLGSVDEFAPPGTPVVTVTAEDSDEGNNGNLTYMIPRGIAGDKFIINPITGLITTTESLDREEQSSYTVTVYVKDDGYPTLYDTTTVSVDVRDVNDHAPEFEKDLYKLLVRENQVQNNIIKIIASDLDVGINADIIYRFSGGNEDGKFDIDPRTGELSCSRPLDREQRDNYTLTVTATDLGSPPLSGTTGVLVTVVDDNDNSPTFSRDVYTATVAEDVAKGLTVMRVFASDPDQGSNGQVTYSFLGNDTEGYFSVNRSSGDIITSGVFDREKNASFQFLLMASDGGGSGPRNSTVRIRITILDVNDNAPVFRQVPYKATVSQATGTGQTVLQMTADDSDAGNNGSVRYALLDATEGYSQEFFQIESYSGAITTKKPLAQALGYHNLLVVATDQGSPALSATGVAEITVGDSSVPYLTFRPQAYFESEEYVKEIKENSPIGTTVTTVRVSYTGSGAVTYSFANGNSHNVFKIDSLTGLVQVANATFLDYESTPQIQLIVAAVAGGNHAYAKLQVNLIDQNDNAPKFAQTHYVLSIHENNKPQTYVTQVWAKDADSGLNGMVEYTIIDGNLDRVFEMNPPHTGIVRTHIDASRLDREIRSSYTLVIEAQDYGTVPRSAICFLHITIVDENDNDPMFPDPGPGPVYIAENRHAGFLVAVVAATDVDLYPMLIYDFTSQGNPDNAFSIDRSSGTVLLAKSLDHEQRSHYTIGLQVTDGKKTVSRTLEVFVTDVNDNAPQFSEQSYQVSVAENTAPGSFVLSVMATDNDDGNNAAVTYSLGASSPPNFFIDPVNGSIYTNQSLSSSASESVLQLVVVARDGGQPSLSSMVAVQVQVNDVNKFSPQFKQPSYCVSVNESLHKGAEVLRVSAIDRDYSHRNDNVHYVLSGPAAATFYIQANTGIILLKQPLDRERTARYYLVAMAVDRGTPPRNTSVPVVITVLDENDNAPVFTRQHFFVSLPENYPSESVFLTVNATDADEGANAELEYSITSGNTDGVFYNYKSGGLFVTTSLDYEMKQSHRLIIRAVDCASCGESAHRLSAFVTVDINVTDVNEFGPKFPFPHYDESVAENLKSYLTVFQVHANDRDGGEFGKVTYEILRGDDQKLFLINPETGDVVTREKFNYESERKVYNITVQATDPDLVADTVGVTIHVTDEDEFTPKFLNKTYAFTVPGSAKAGAFVGRVFASDDDGGAAGKLVYSFNHPSDYFQVDPLSGIITVSHTLHGDIADVAEDESQLQKKRRRQRALRKDWLLLEVRVSSGMENSRFAIAKCNVIVDRTCGGCQAPTPPELVDSRGLNSLAIAMIVLVSILVPAVIVVVLLVFFCRRRNRKGVPGTAMNGSAAGYGNRADFVLGIVPPPIDGHAPPAYSNRDHHHHHHGRHHHHGFAVNYITSSDFSEQSNNSASSGRGGSAEVEEDEDEEIRMINSNYLTNSATFRHKTMPDSGIQQDEDTLSEPSATNHHEYLARLGIDSSKIGKSAAAAPSSNASSANNSNPNANNVPKASSSFKGSTSGSEEGGDIALSVEGMHQFSDEGGAEGGVDFDRFTDTEVDEEMVMIENTRLHNMHQAMVGMPPSGGGMGGVRAGLVGVGGALSFQAPEPHQAGTLSNVVNSEEEYSGSYNWDYLLDWGPQYQPLAHVFTEIAKFKDESVTPKKTPVKTVPQRRTSGTQGLAPPPAPPPAPPLARIVPPPIITNAPPPVLDSGDE